jgi:tRNA-modifying protein YgfZ
MSEPTAVDLAAPADGLGALAFRGADVARFLQGQLSADIEKLKVGDSTLAGLHNPQGRVVALLALVRLSADEFLATLPRELCPTVEQRLRKFILRSKVSIEDVSTSVAILGHVSGDPGPEFPRVRWGDRTILVVPLDRRSQFRISGESPETWKRADIAAGLPQVFTATSETFVAQMLNLDLLGGIAFDKGCYTGQEVIARAHYRGRVKRRLQRWQGSGAQVPRAGDAVRSRDGRSLTVVSAAGPQDAAWEILAVGPFAAEASASVMADGQTAAVEVDPLPLPYALPE